MTTKKEILKSIRAKCLDCCCGQRDEVKKCTLTTCPLYQFRLGMDPNPNKPRGIAKRSSAGTVSSENPKNKIAIAVGGLIDNE